MRPSVERLRQVLTYNHDTGALMHRSRPGRLRRGEPATRKDADGYLRVSVDGISCKAHRVAWAIVHGEWPVDEIDHKNGLRDDNRIRNLRPATHAENGQNRAVQKNSRSGYQGVSWHARSGKWRAQICSGGRRRDLGLFDSPEEGSTAYLNAKSQLHPYQPSQRMGQSMERNKKPT